MNDCLIKKVDSKDIMDTCVQVVFSFEKELCIIEKGSTNFIYLDKHTSNIPYYVENVDGKELFFVNRMLEYNKIYVVIKSVNKKIVETYCKVIKDKDEVIFIESFDLSCDAFLMNASELRNSKYIENFDSNQKKLVRK